MILSGVRIQNWMCRALALTPESAASDIRAVPTTLRAEAAPGVNLTISHIGTDRSVPHSAGPSKKLEAILPRVAVRLGNYILQKGAEPVAWALVAAQFVGPFIRGVNALLGDVAGQTTKAEVALGALIIGTALTELRKMGAARLFNRIHQACERAELGIGARALLKGGLQREESPTQPKLGLSQRLRHLILDQQAPLFQPYCISRALSERPTEAPKPEQKELKIPVLKGVQSRILSECTAALRSQWEEKVKAFPNESELILLLAVVRDHGSDEIIKTLRAERLPFWKAVSPPDAIDCAISAISARSLVEILKTEGFDQVEVKKDYFGRYSRVELQLPSNPSAELPGWIGLFSAKTEDGVPLARRVEFCFGGTTASGSYSSLSRSVSVDCSPMMLHGEHPPTSSTLLLKRHRGYPGNSAEILGHEQVHGWWDLAASHGVNHWTDVWLRGVCNSVSSGYRLARHGTEPLAQTYSLKVMQRSLREHAGTLALLRELTPFALSELHEVATEIRTTLNNRPHEEGSLVSMYRETSWAWEELSRAAMHAPTGESLHVRIRPSYWEPGAGPPDEAALSPVNGQFQLRLRPGRKEPCAELVLSQPSGEKLFAEFELPDELVQALSPTTLSILDHSRRIPIDSSSIPALEKDLKNVWDSFLGPKIHECGPKAETDINAVVSTFAPARQKAVELADAVLALRNLCDAAPSERSNLELVSALRAMTLELASELRRIPSPRRIGQAPRTLKDFPAKSSRARTMEVTSVPTRSEDVDSASS